MPLSDRMAVGMALALLLLPFLPASGILLQVGFVIAERLAPSYHSRVVTTHACPVLIQGALHAQSGLLSAGDHRDKEIGKHVPEGMLNGIMV